MDTTVGARIAALEAEIAELKKVVAVDTGPPTSDRRGMIKLVAATAVGAVTGATMLGAEPAAAIDGQTSAVLGFDNQSQATTGFTAANDSAISAVGAFVGIESDGSFANAWFPGSGGPPTPSPGGIAGLLYVDGDGTWWASVLTVDPTQGTDVWRKLAGLNTAGQLHLLPAPVRVLDSRVGQHPTVANEIRAVNTTVVGNTGAPSGVPIDANAVLVTLTVTGPLAPGFATAWPTGPWPGTSSINFAASQDIATTTVVGCGAGATIQILSNTVTNFLIDVIGYYQ